MKTGLRPRNIYFILLRLIPPTYEGGEGGLGGVGGERDAICRRICNRIAPY